MKLKSVKADAQRTGLGVVAEIINVKPKTKN